MNKEYNFTFNIVEGLYSRPTTIEISLLRREEQKYMIFMSTCCKTYSTTYRVRNVQKYYFSPHFVKNIMSRPTLYSYTVEYG